MSLTSLEHGINQHNVGGSNLSPNIDRGRQYQIQRLKRDAPDIAIKVINREISAKQGAKRKNPLRVFLRRCVFAWAVRCCNK